MKYDRLLFLIIEYTIIKVLGKFKVRGRKTMMGGIPIPDPTPDPF